MCFKNLHEPLKQHRNNQHKNETYPTSQLNTCVLLQMIVPPPQPPPTSSHHHHHLFHLYSRSPNPIYLDWFVEVMPIISDHYDMSPISKFWTASTKLPLVVTIIHPLPGLTRPSPWCKIDQSCIIHDCLLWLRLFFLFLYITWMYSMYHMLQAVPQTCSKSKDQHWYQFLFLNFDCCNIKQGCCSSPK